MKLFFIVIGILFLIFFADALICRKWLEFTKTSIVCNIKKACRIIHISDLHDYSYGKGNERLIRLIENDRPDYICISGDLLNSKGKSAAKTIRLLEELNRIAKVIYVRGNHELIFNEYDSEAYNEYITAVKKTGTILLDDSEYDSNDFSFYGYTNKMKEYKKFGGIYPLTLEEMTEDIPVPKKSFSILLAHNPVYFDIYTRWGADLILSGHLHGGIIRLPFIGGIISPQTFFGRKYSAGLYEKNGKYMYVSRGLGLHTLHIRIFNRPELARIDLIPENKR